MGWSWVDVQRAPTGVVLEAFRLMEDSESETVQQQSAAELRLKALQAAKVAKGRR